MYGIDTEGKRIIYAIPNGLAGTEKAAFRRCYIDEDGQFKVDEGIDIKFYMRDISDRGCEGTCEQDGENYDKKKQEIYMDRYCADNSIVRNLYRNICKYEWKRYDSGGRTEKY